MRTTLLWNNLHHVRSKSNDWKSKYSKSAWYYEIRKDPNKTANIHKFTYASWRRIRVSIIITLFKNCKFQ